MASQDGGGIVALASATRGLPQGYTRPYSGGIESSQD